MIVQIHLFARAKDLVGQERITVELPAGATVRELRQQLQQTYPQLTELLARSALALNSEFAQDDDRIPAQADIAVLPPVSGGCSLSAEDVAP